MRPLACVAVILGAALATPVELELVPGPPQWVAFRDGEGGWQVQVANRSRYTAEANGRFYEWVTVCGDNVTHLRMVLDEIAYLRWQCVDGSRLAEPEPQPSVEVSANLRGLNTSRSRARQTATLYLGRSGQFSSLNAPTVSLSFPTASPLDLVAVRRSLTSPTPDRMLIFRQLQPQSEALGLDFASPRALPLTAYVLQVGGLQIAGEPVAPASVRWHTCGGTVVWLGDAVRGSNWASSRLLR